MWFAQKLMYQQSDGSFQGYKHLMNFAELTRYCKYLYSWSAVVLHICLTDSTHIWQTLKKSENIFKIFVPMISYGFAFKIDFFKSDDLFVLFHHIRTV